MNEGVDTEEAGRIGQPDAERISGRILRPRDGKQSGLKFQDDPPGQTDQSGARGRLERLPAAPHCTQPFVIDWSSTLTNRVHQFMNVR